MMDDADPIYEDPGLTDTEYLVDVEFTNTGPPAPTVTDIAFPGVNVRCVVLVVT